MYGKIKIGDKEIEMVANGATPYWYNQVFHREFFAETQDINDGTAADVFARIGFIMAKQAESANFNKVNEGQFYSWLENFNPLDIPNALPDIVDLYTGQTKGTAKAKK